MLNIACLRSDCPVALCDRLDDLDRDPACESLDGDFSFEQAVLSRVAQTTPEVIEDVSRE
jgi:hypothetical protein